jgi:hypothetical protein
MGLLAFCLDPNNRPPDSSNWFQKSFELEADGASRIVVGPRIDWFALEMRELYSTVSARHIDKCIKNYMDLRKLDNAEEISSAADVMWPVEGLET